MSFQCSHCGLEIHTGSPIQLFNKTFCIGCNPGLLGKADWRSVADMGDLKPDRLYEIRFTDGSTALGEWHPFWKWWINPETDETFSPGPDQWREAAHAPT